MKRTNNYFDFDDRFDEERYTDSNLLRSRSILDRDRDCDDDDDYDFCENACDDLGGSEVTTRNSSRRPNECECKPECNDRCRDDENHRDKCRCRNNNYSGDCNEDIIHCSDYQDFNFDERFGCRPREDAANSDDSWFERENETCCNRCRELCEEDKCLCKKIKCRIQVLDFALQETIQFLNTHPCDYEALRYYRIVSRKLNRLEKIYERKCGPLTNKNVDTEYGWEWACCPWPWEGKE